MKFNVDLFEEDAGLGDTVSRAIKVITRNRV